MSNKLQISRTLGNGLTLRAVTSDADVDKVVAINAEIHGEGDIVRHWLMQGHPVIFREGWLYVEDEATGQAVATLCLIPMTWRYGGQPLPVAELGFVATLPDYRGRGLQRVLSKAFEELALERGDTLAAIEGIPGFYGQFGYEYAVPLNDAHDVEFDQVPGATEHATRPATPDDVPALQRLFDASTAALDLTGLRDAALWTHQLSVPGEIPFYATTTLVERDRRVVGYLRWGNDGWSDRLAILELAVDGGPGADERILDALRFARDQGQAQGDRSGLRLRLPASHPAVSLALDLGAVEQGRYGWQMQVLDPVGFMRAIGPALEARLAASELAGYDGSLVFDLYRSRLALRFERGKLVQVSAPGSEAQTHAGLRLKTATQLWLGWRGRQALQDWYPDFRSQETARPLLDVLFPQARAWVYTPY
jgi:predicted N-acetyltransferase YhbS